MLFNLLLCVWRNVTLALDFLWVTTEMCCRINFYTSFRQYWKIALVFQNHSLQRMLKVVMCWGRDYTFNTSVKRRIKSLELWCRCKVFTVCRHVSNFKQHYLEKWSIIHSSFPKNVLLHQSVYFLKWMNKQHAHLTFFRQSAFFTLMNFITIIQIENGLVNIFRQTLLIPGKTTYKKTFPKIRKTIGDTFKTKWPLTYIHELQDTHHKKTGKCYYTMDIQILFKKYSDSEKIF